MKNLQFVNHAQMNYWRKKVNQMNNQLEITEINDYVERIMGMNKDIIEGLPIHGFVTVIKNKGRKNEQILCEDKPNLLTTDGRDSFHDKIYTDAVASVGFVFIAVTSDTGAPAAGDTILTGEITSGGLTRILASTRTHIDDTNVSTIEHTFTAVAPHVAVQKSGLFDIITIGILSHENTFTEVTLVVNDTLTITWTLTLG